MRLPKTLREWALATVAFVWSLFVGVVVVGFLTAWATEAGLFAEPGRKMMSVINFLLAAPGNPFVAWPVGLLLGGSAGFAAGVWLDARQRLKGRPSIESLLPVACEGGAGGAGPHGTKGGQGGSGPAAGGGGEGGHEAVLPDGTRIIYGGAGGGGSGPEGGTGGAGGGLRGGAGGSSAALPVQPPNPLSFLEAGPGWSKARHPHVEIKSVRRDVTGGGHKARQVRAEIELINRTSSELSACSILVQSISTDGQLSPAMVNVLRGRESRHQWSVHAQGTVTAIMAYRNYEVAPDHAFTLNAAPPNANVLAQTPPLTVSDNHTHHLNLIVDSGAGVITRAVVELVVGEYEELTVKLLGQASWRRLP